MATRIGVLALQGAFREHGLALRRLGAEPVEVRTPADLETVEALVIPGGESTTIDKLLDWSRLREPLVARLAAGMPAFGTCAGLIVLAAEAEDATPDQRLLGMIDLTARRNGYGRQVRSFEAPLALAGETEPMHGVFIRAPRIVRLGEGVEVVATLDGEPVAAASGAIMVCAFHPELAGDDRLHRRFLASVAAAARAA
jgi:pyridoxal 5'-phosphate synthase pdxT subunit